MNRRIEALYVVLQEACKEQFGFAPERIKENLQYLGTVDASDEVASTIGKPEATAVHRFRDHVWGAEIHLALNPVSATLFQRPHMVGLDWAERLQTEYSKTDVQQKAERDDRDEKVKYTLGSSLWASVGPFVRSQFPSHESYADGAIASIGLYQLIERLAEKGEPDFLAFSDRIGAKDTEGLSWFLQLAYQHEHELAVWEQVKGHANIQAIDNLLDKVIAGHPAAYGKVMELAEEVCDSVPKYDESSMDNDLIITLVMRNRVARQQAPALDDASPTP